MEKILYLWIFFVFGCCIAACEQDNNSYESEGLITGYDLTLCACCGGFFVEIDNTVYRGELPDAHGLDTSPENLPLAVYLDWEIVIPSCSEEIILITAVEAQ